MTDIERRSDERNEQLESVETISENNDEYISFKIKKINLKQSKIFIALGLVAVLVIAGVFFLNSKKLEKYDENGNPIYYELTNEVYSNIEDYVGYYVMVKGKMFNQLDESDGEKGIQVWADPKNNDNNTMIYFTSDVEIEQGDYIICKGYVSKITTFTNTYGTELKAPLIKSDDLVKSNYIDVMAPTIKTFTPKNANQTQAGYTIQVDKIEFAKNETRVYITAINNGKSELNIDTDVVLVQNGKQFEVQNNYEADYKELTNDLVAGVTDTGILTYPVIEEKDFELNIKVWSQDVYEEINDFKISVRLNDDGEVEKNSLNDNQADTKNQNNNSNSAPIINNSISTNELALQRANELIKTYSAEGISRTWLKEWLTDVDGYSYDNVEYAVNNCSIDWNLDALTFAQSYLDEEHICPGDIRYDLVERGFTNSEMEYAINNVGIDWNSKAVLFASDAYNGIMDRESLIEKLTNAFYGFTYSQAAYGVDNSGITWE